MRMGHVQWAVDLLLVSTAQASSRLISIVEETDFVESIKLSGLSRDVAGGEVEPREEIRRFAVVDELGDNVAVPVRIELVDHRSSELR